MEIMIVVLVIAVIAAVAVPNFLSARAKSQRSACIKNLREIDSAVQQWAIDNKKPSKTLYTLTDPKVLVYFKGSKLPVCPSGGTYVPIGVVSSVPLCTFKDSLGHSL